MLPISKAAINCDCSSENKNSEQNKTKWWPLEYAAFAFPLENTDFNSELKQLLIFSH